MKHSKIIMKSIINFIDGRFGKRVLKPKYRTIWQFITYGTIVVIIFWFVLCPFFDYCCKIADALNYMICG